MQCTDILLKKNVQKISNKAKKTVYIPLIIGYNRPIINEEFIL